MSRDELVAELCVKWTCTVGPSDDITVELHRDLWKLLWACIQERDLSDTYEMI